MRWLVMVVCALGCAGPAAGVRGEAKGTGWRRVETAHVSLFTDLSDEDARGAVTELEQTYVALVDVAFPGAARGQQHLTAVAFRRVEDYEAVGPVGSGGVFWRGRSIDLEQEALMAYGGELTDRSRLTLRHELTHWLMGQLLPQAPVWMQEGTAEYFSTFELRDGAMILGRTPPKYDFGKRPDWVELQAGKSGRTMPLLLVPIPSVPKASALLKTDAKSFYLWDAGDEMASARYRTAHYAGSWALVHLLRNGPEGIVTRFADYVHRLERSEPPFEAWASAFEAVPESALDQAHLELMRAPQRMLLRREYTPPKVEITRDELLDEAGYRLVQARLAWHRGPEGLAEAKRYLDAGLAEAPSNAALRRARGVVELRLQMTTQALADLEAARKAEPAGTVLALALASFEAAGSKATAALDELAETLERAPTPAAARFLAEYHGRAGRMPKALAFARRAVEGAPAAWENWDTYSRVLEAKGALGLAVDAARRAFNLVPERMRVPSVAKHLLALERKARKSAAASAASAAE